MRAPLPEPGLEPAPGSRVGAGAFWAVVLGTTALRAVLAAVLPLSGDELYYWDCSRHLDWTYHDQPALVIWGMIPFRAVLGETALAVRAPALVGSALVAVFLRGLVLRLGGGQREATLAYGILHATPAFFAGSFYASTDALLLPAYVGAAWAAVAIAQGERRAWWGFGAAVGLGFQAKFPIVSVLPALVPVLLQREARAHLRTPTPWLAALACLVLTGPVWIWGALHDWDNVRFQLGRASNAFEPGHLLDLLVFWTWTFVVLTPFVGPAAARAWWRACRRREPGWSTYCVAAASALGFFSVMTLRGETSAHWGLPSVVTAVAALALLPVPRRRFAIRAGAVTTAILVGGAVALVLRPELALALERSVRPHTDRPDKLETAELFGHAELVAELTRRRRPGELVASKSYSDVHGVAFYSGGALETRLFRGRSHGLASLYWHRPGELRGRDVLYFTEKDEVDERLAPVFERVVEEDPFVVRVDGEPVRTFRILRCTNLLEPAPLFTRLREEPAPDASRR